MTADPDPPPIWLAAVALGAVLLLVMLAGCSTTPVLPEVVKIPVRVPCVEAREVPKLPAVVTDAELARMDDYDLTLTIAAERDDLFAWALEASALLKACTKRENVRAQESDVPLSHYLGVSEFR